MSWWTRKTTPAVIKFNKLVSSQLSAHPNGSHLTKQSHGLKRSMLTGSKPQPPIGIITPVSLKEIAVPLTNSESIFARLPTFLAPLLGTELWQILLDLNQFTAFVSYFRSHRNEFCPGKCVSFEHWNAALEYRLLSYSPPNDGINICDNNFKEALRVAAVLWVSTGLWTFPRPPA
jgi:hypothetical protein